jgi:2-polyprenyl-3-methyl-5-hydroxy-6-metoxy-1,4-benzoquinol methylase
MNRSEKFWDKIARKYSKEKIKDEEGYEKTLDDTRKYLTKEACVLEVGCGTGTTALKFSGSVNAMTATDISANMIAIAEERAQEQKVQNVKFEQSTLFDEKLVKGSFDVILAFNFVHLLEDTPGVMKRINELLKPGGIFISKTACLSEKSWFWPAFACVVGKVMRVGAIQCFTVEQYKDFITSEGFEIVDTHLYFPKPPRLFAVARKVEENKESAFLKAP